MSIVAVGLDLVAIARVERLLAGKGERAMHRLLTEGERAYCEAQPVVARSVAVRLAAKEAAFKALQGSDAARGIQWRDVEVIRDPSGRPELALHGTARRVARRRGVQSVFLSLSHTDSHAAAVVVLQS